MAEIRSVLVDTSVWVRFFRSGQSPEAIHLEELLQLRAVVTCDPIQVEVASGARTDHERKELHEVFAAIPLFNLPPDVWRQIEEARFTLARKGRQASLIDLMIAATAQYHGTLLWSLDTDFAVIHGALPFPMYHPTL